jgi:predicted metalloprotease
MTFQGNGPLDTSAVSAGGGVGRSVMIGGGSIGTVIIGLLIYFLTGGSGGDPNSVAPGGAPNGGSGAALSQSEQELNARLKNCTIEQANSDTACRIVATTNSLNKVWAGLLRGYQPVANTKIMPVDAKSINTKCGVASADTGPFYCPADNIAVFQLDFMDRVIQKMGGSNGAFSQEYIVAHEWGHHIQTLLGDIKNSQQGSGAQGGSVRTELQADCYAGVWGSRADKGPNAMLKPLTQQDIAGAIQTAQAIGDDTIQRNAGRNPNPESFSHGTSAQRVKWFTTGYQTGDVNQCDTFSGAI